jgi:hypothetical protein
VSQEFVLGFGLVLYFFKTTLSKFAIPIIWTTSIFSGLFFLSVYGSWLAIFTIPVSLLFCLIKMTTSNDRTKIYFPLIINLVFYKELYFIQYTTEGLVQHGFGKSGGSVLRRHICG